MAIAAYYRAIPPNIRGMALMVVAAIAVNVMVVAIRQIKDDVHIFEIGFVRHVFSFLFFLPIFMRSGTAIFVTRRLGMLTLRAVLNVIAMFVYFIGVTLIPMSEVTALGFTTPLFVAVLAVLFLGEKMGPVRLIGLALGFGGALLILRPGVENIAWGSVCILVSSSTWAFALIVIKKLTRTESTLTIAMYASLLQLPLSFIPALFVWTWPDFYQLSMIFLIAICGSTTHLAVAQAFREADTTVVMPVDFTKIIWASLAGYLFFAEIPDILTLIGGAVVFTGVLYIALRERNGKAKVG